MSELGRAMAVASRDLLKTLVITSDYEFQPEGVRVFKKAFDQAMKEENIVSPPTDFSPLQAGDNLEDAALPSNLTPLFLAWLYELIFVIYND
jgi:hypothetical protein